MAPKPGNQRPRRGLSKDPASPSPIGKEHAASELAWMVALVKSTDDAAMIAKDSDGTIVAWNAEAEQLFGYTPAEAVGHPIAMLVPPEAWDEFEQILERVDRGERISGFETVRQRKDGSRVQVSLTISPVADSQGVVGSLLIARDLSERKRRESEILKGRARLRTILDTAVDAIITIDGRGLIQTINPATERLFRYTAGELIGQNVKILMPSPYHEAHDGFVARYKETGEKRIIGAGREVQGRRKDGTVFPIDLSVSEVEPGTLFTGIVRDLSERKMLEASLRQADRMATIGAVAAGLGHDLNNLLLLLRMNTDALSKCPLPPDGAAAVQSLQNVTGYLRDLARGLRLLSLDPENRGNGAVRTTSLTDWCPSTAALFKTMSRPGVSVELMIPPGLPDVRIAPHQLTQIVFNLVSNAVNAIVEAPRDDRGWVEVSAGPRPGGNGIRLQVADNGRGMPAEVLARAFEPLFTTRQGRGGTGLGLALVKRLVTDAGGELSIESKPDTGTTVTIDLCAAIEIEAVSQTAANRPGAVVSLTDVHAAALVRRVLKSLGAPVRADNDPNRARLWIVDPAAADVNEVERWLADRQQRRQLILFGRPLPGPATDWDALQPLIIEDPDDFEGLRATIARAVAAE